eukprot:gene13142-3464_t
MGLTMSKADGPDSSAPPPLPNFANLSIAAAAAIKDAAKAEAPDYLDLPPPCRYEDLQRECMMALKPDLFEGMRFEITKPVNQHFFLQHSLFMGNMELSTGGKQIIKAPHGTYDFSANVIKSEKFMMLGRINTEGRLSGRLKFDLADWLGFMVMIDTNVKGKDWNSQLKLGNPSFMGINYFQSVTPNFQAGGELFYLASNLKSGVGMAMRHSSDKHVATAQIATTGILSLQYAHKVNEKITLATDFLLHMASREATATMGYDCMLRQCRLRGKVDTNGVVSTFLEERFSPGINFVLSAELDHWNSNYKFGFGVVAGE